MTRLRNLSLAAAVLLLALHPAARADLLEQFNDDPVANGRATVVGSNQSTDTTGAPAVPFVVSTPGVLTQNLNTNWRMTGGVPDISQYQADASRLHFPLGKTYTQDDSFAFGARLRINRTGFFWSGNFMQMNFGLLNAATTGMSRTGHPDAFGWATGADSYDSVEWDFFPDNTGANATAQQVILGTQNGATSVFSRFAANFGVTLPSGPAPYEYGLPISDTPIWMDVTVTYDGTARVARVSVIDIATGTPLVTAATCPDLAYPDVWGPPFGDGTDRLFAIDTLAILNYQDGMAGLSPSLVANVEYQNVWFQAASPPVEEPAGLLALGLLGLAGPRRRRA